MCKHLKIPVVVAVVFAATATVLMPKNDSR